MEPTLSDNTPLVTAYFDQFVGAFATFDGKQVADLIAPPFIAVSDSGSQRALLERRDVVEYYQAALDEYHAAGCRFCRWSDLSVTSMGDRALVAAVTWDLLREDGTIAARWRQSYGLNLFEPGRPKAFSAVSHAGH